MRTDEEILKRIKASDSLFGFDRQTLVLGLSKDAVKEFLKEGASEDWEQATDETLKKEALAYLEFAWGKAQDHRGLSAGRSIDKLTAYAWLLGDDALVEAIDGAEYRQYGAPKLAVVSRAWGAPMPDDAKTLRMVEGLPCHPECDEGCGR